MYSLNDGIKKITIIEVLVLVLALTGLVILFDIIGHPISEKWIYVGVIIYFIYRLRFFTSEFKHDLNNIFAKITPKSLITIVLVNFFFSYGMLYLSIFALENIPGFKAVISAHLFSIMALGSLAGIGGLLSTVLVSPICEELLFSNVGDLRKIFNSFS